jgi:hypothetical protein
MSEQSPKSNAFNEPLPDPARCQHRHPSGRRCRLPVSDLHTGLCAHHTRLRFVREEAHLSSALFGELKKFETAAEVNDVLSRLLLLVSQDRVSPRRAAVMAYICNLLLRSVPKPENEPPEIIFDAPRPERSYPEPGDPQPSSARDQVNAKT